MILWMIVHKLRQFRFPTKIYDRVKNKSELPEGEQVYLLYTQADIEDVRSNPTHYYMLDESGNSSIRTPLKPDAFISPYRTYLKLPRGLIGLPPGVSPRSPGPLASIEKGTPSSNTPIQTSSNYSDNALTPPIGASTNLAIIAPMKDVDDEEKIGDDTKDSWKDVSTPESLVAISATTVDLPRGDDTRAGEDTPERLPGFYGGGARVYQSTPDDKRGASGKWATISDRNLERIRNSNRGNNNNNNSTTHNNSDGHEDNNQQE